MCIPDEDEVPTTPYRSQSHLVAANASAESDVIIEPFPVEFNGFTYTGQIAYKRGAEKKPLILIFPNYAGLKQFDIDQAVFMAKLGYVGLACDLYMYPIEERNPGPDSSKQERGAHFASAFSEMNGLLKDQPNFRKFMGTYLELGRQHSAVHQTLAAAIGYCFGGQCCLDMVRHGFNLSAIVTYHGVLQSNPSNILQEPNFDGTIIPAPNNYATNCKVLIENGDLDSIVPQKAIDKFKAEMDSQGIDWRFNNHSQTKHGFALAPGVLSTEYDEDADRRSTLSTISLFAEVFPEFPVQPVSTNACGTELGQFIVNTGYALKARL